MSVNRYDASTGELVTLASGTRTWIGTKAAYEAAKSAGTLPNNCLIAITDDEEDHNHYSTDETFTGNYWIDGKKIYRKVIETTSPATAQDTIITPIANVANIINIYGMLQYSANQQEPINWSYTTMAPSATYYASGNIRQRVDSSRSSKPEYIIVEYTKTID